MYDWLIIGGGIHGTHLSLALTRRYGIPLERVAVLDPFDVPLARWNQVTRNTSMRYLRSPHVHNLHYDQGALAVFARIHDGETYTNFIPPFHRPSLALFQAHSQYLIDKYRLRDMRIKGYARNLCRSGQGWLIETDDTPIKARNIMLAIGGMNQTRWPQWAVELQNAGASVHHIFDAAFDYGMLLPDQRVIVVGGGISAAQTALAMADTHPGKVTFLSRHKARIQDFDTDTGWMNAIYLRDFAQVQDFNKRREIIDGARYPGSMPHEVYQAVQYAVHAGTLDFVVNRVDMAQANGLTQLKLADGSWLAADHVLLATGFHRARPGGIWLENVVNAYSLPTAACGYPIVDSALRWADGLFVTGPLAELELGPAARNIIGARMTGERLKFAAVHAR